MDSVKKGTRTALTLFGVIIAIHVILFVVALFVSEAQFLLLVAGLFTLPGGLIAAVVISFTLEKGARASFWLTSVIGLVVTFAIWWTTCGAAFGIGLAG